jgi:hypothetical protein
MSRVETSAVNKVIYVPQFTACCVCYVNATLYTIHTSTTKIYLVICYAGLYMYTVVRNWDVHKSICIVYVLYKYYLSIRDITCISYVYKFKEQKNNRYILWRLILVYSVVPMLQSFGEFLKFPKILENPGISGKSGNFGKCRGKFPGFRGKLFFGILEIPKLSGTFSENFVFFIKTALCSRVHSITFRVKLVKIPVFS